MNIFKSYSLGEVKLLAFHKNLKEIERDRDTLKRWCEPTFRTLSEKLLNQERDFFLYIRETYGVDPEVFDMVLVIPNVCELDFTNPSSPKLRILDSETRSRETWCSRHLKKISKDQLSAFPPQVIQGIKNILKDI